MDATLVNFDPDSPGQDNGNLYGLPHSIAQAAAVVIPVPWDSTVSYRAGTAAGPAAILAASLQVDLYDYAVPDAWRRGMAMLPIPENIRNLNTQTRPKAFSLIQALEARFEHPQHEALLAEVNHASTQVNQWVQEQAQHVVAKGKVPVVLGGDHSSPLGLMQVLANTYPMFGILQIDAHMDLREAYEGFEYSHASIMHHALQLPQVQRLVQVGIRDHGQGEWEIASTAKDRIVCLTERTRMAQQFAGQTWHAQAQKLVESLPHHVYISFDIDGLDPSLCPDTGTPVPGGLGFEEALYLIELIAQTGRNIIGFDLCEVAPGVNEWNAIVGARVLYRMFAASLKSQT